MTTIETTSRPTQRRPGRRAALVLWGIAAITAATITAGKIGGLRLNFTPSAPVGLWRVIDSPDELRSGMIVSVCPPAAAVVDQMLDGGFLARGSCPAGSMPLLKPVAAIAGDRVEIRSGVAARVNGQDLPNTAPVTGLAVPDPGTYVVAPGTVWLFSSYHQQSFDSRYYGAVPIANVLAQAVPVWVSGDPANLTKNAIITRGH